MVSRTYVLNSLSFMINTNSPVHMLTSAVGYTAVMLASLRGDTESLKLLLEHGANVSCSVSDIVIITPISEPCSMFKRILSSFNVELSE